MDNVKRTEQIATSHNPKAPRISLDAVLGSIKEENYFLVGDALFKTGAIKGPYEDHPAAKMTICVAVMHNGFIVIGKTAPASPANFDPEVGKKLAREDCIRQIWPLLGFALRQEITKSEYLQRDVHGSQAKA